MACLSTAALAHEHVKEDIVHREPACQKTSYQDADYTICKFDPSQYDIRTFLRGEGGEILGSFEAVNAELAKNGEQLLFGMNGGMYYKDRTPVGGYVETGRSYSKMNTNKGPGNFHMLPNGVFWLTQMEDAVATYKGGHVGTTENYKNTAENVMDATQSGPMLVIDGTLHPRFNKGSTSRKIRNGVGKTKSDKLVFVKSETAVNFYDFASLFKDELQTANALYLDGTISRVYSTELDRVDLGLKMGPIIGVVVPKVKSEAQYIANEAVLMTHGETKIMFDPLPLSGFGTYPETSEEDIAAMMAGEGAYVGMDAVFISHAHSDHFSAAKMIAYMRAQPDVWLIAPQQALDLMKQDAAWDEGLVARMRIMDMEAGDAPQEIVIGNIKATAVRIPHAGWPAPKRASVQNMVYRVTLNGDITIMHMGDADPRRQHFTPHKDHWAEQRTDTAFPPYWFLTSPTGRSILEDNLNVASSIGVHVPLKIPADLKDSGQDYFSKSGETRAVGE